MLTTAARNLRVGVFGSVKRSLPAIRHVPPLFVRSATYPATQRVAFVREQKGPVEFLHDYPTPKFGYNEVLAKVLYTGVCQSDLHTMKGTAAGADGKNITNIKLPHIGGHEGVGRVMAVGAGVKGEVPIGSYVGIRFISRICRRCEFCLAGQEQHCIGGMTNHLHHEDGAFQEYIALDGGQPHVVAGRHQSCRDRSHTLRWNNRVQVQYAKVIGARVIAIDGGSEKRDYCLSLGADEFVDFAQVHSTVDEVQRITKGGAHGVVCTAGNPKAYAQAAYMLRIRGTLACGGIPPGTPHLETSIGAIVIKGLRIIGSLVGSLKDTMEVVELTRTGKVKPTITVRPWEDLPKVYEELERNAVQGRVVLKIAEDE